MVAHRGDVERRDPQAARADLLDHPVRLQQGHGLLHRLAGDPQTLGQLFLLQVCLRRKRAGADLVQNGAIDQFGAVGCGLNGFHNEF